MVYKCWKVRSEGLENNDFLKIVNTSLFTSRKLRHQLKRFGLRIESGKRSARPAANLEFRSRVTHCTEWRKRAFSAYPEGTRNPQRVAREPSSTPVDSADAHNYPGNILLIGPIFGNRTLLRDRTTDRFENGVLPRSRRDRRRAARTDAWKHFVNYARGPTGRCTRFLGPRQVVEHEEDCVGPRPSETETISTVFQ